MLRRIVYGLVLAAFSVSATIFLGSSVTAQTARPESTQGVAPFQVFPPKPQLRINTDSHSARVTKIAISADERLLITGSRDKTLKIWSLPHLELLDSFRPPIGESWVGLVNSVAISPDNQSVAVGGYLGNYTDLDSEGQEFIYIFDLGTGRIRQTISGVRSRVYALAFSPDGTHLVGGMKLGHGVSVWKTNDWTEVHSDTDYGDDVYDLAFDGKGRLATTSYDGYVRLYDEDFDLTQRRKMPHGDYPHGITFSPDASMLAVTYAYVPTTEANQPISLLSTEDLSTLRKLEAPVTTSDFTGFISVAWSNDSQYLFGSGYLYDPNEDRQGIRRWSNSGLGDATDFWTSSAWPIMHIRAYGTSGIVFGSMDGTIGYFDDGGTLITLSAEQLGGMVQTKPVINVDVSSDGRQIGLTSMSGNGIGTFDIQKRELIEGPNPGLSLTPATTRSVALDFDPSDPKRPRLNGKSISLRPGEEMTSFAMSQDGRFLLLGSEFGLRYFDARGELLWEKSVNCGCISNLTPDGKFAVVINDDGTIHWHRLSDGQILLTLFIHADFQRWIMWTPEGYYDASARGEDLIGWHLNRAGQSSLFYGASRYRDTYYRPDIIDRLFGAYDLENAQEVANSAAGLPNAAPKPVDEMKLPVVRVLSPKNGGTFSSDTVALTLDLDSPSGKKITDVQVRANGNPAGGGQYRGVGVQQDSDSTLMVRLPRRDVLLEVLAKTEDGWGEPAKVHLTFDGTSTESPKPVLYALLIGVSDYRDDALDLRYAAKDAEDISSFFDGQKGLFYQDVKTKLLPNDLASKGAIEDGLQWLRSNVTANDYGLVFLAGHGVNEAGKYFFFPHDVNEDDLGNTAVDAATIQETFYSIEGEAFLFIDTCHSGSLLRRQHFYSDANALMNRAVDAGAIVFSATNQRQLAIERMDWGNGAFTEIMIEALLGAGDRMTPQDNHVDVNELHSYLNERVTEITHGQQSPQRQGFSPTIPILSEVPDP